VDNIQEYERYNAYAFEYLLDAQKAINDAVHALSKGNDLLSDALIDEAVRQISGVKTNRKHARFCAEKIGKEE
jgi:hypothetical protein